MNDAQRWARLLNLRQRPLSARNANSTRWLRHRPSDNFYSGRVAPWLNRLAVSRNDNSCVVERESHGPQEELRFNEFRAGNGMGGPDKLG
jgi:hypothetical protein